MITPAYVQYLARYNRWQNGQVYACAGQLSEPERQRETGAFFGSISGTLNHLLWGDRMWMHRFAGWQRPPGGARDPLCASWAELEVARRGCDGDIIAWAETLDPEWLNGELTWYSGTLKQDLARPMAVAVGHLFNHQTHHRGQVHCMLTQLGLDPGATDLAMMPAALQQG